MEREENICDAFLGTSVF